MSEDGYQGPSPKEFWEEWTPQERTEYIDALPENDPKRKALMDFHPSVLAQAEGKGETS